MRIVCSIAAIAVVAFAGPALAQPVDKAMILHPGDKVANGVKVRAVANRWRA